MNLIENPKSNTFRESTCMKFGKLIEHKQLYGMTANCFKFKFDVID
jgi:hypothetical protein